RVVPAAARRGGEALPGWAHEPGVEGRRPLGDAVHPRLLAVPGDEGVTAALDDRGLEPVEGRVDGAGRVAGPDEVEGDRADVGLGEAVLPHRAGLVGLPGAGEELLDLLPLVPGAHPSDDGEHRAHRAASSPLGAFVARTSAASCPHAPSMSLPRVSRTVVGIPAARSVRTKVSSTSGAEAV